MRFAAPFLLFPTTIALLAALAPSSIASAFEIHRHALMTRATLQNAGVSGPAVGSAVLGAMWPDAVGCVLYAYCDPPYNLGRPAPSEDRILGDLSLNHFDNDRFDDSIARVNQRMGQAYVLWRSLAGSANPWPDEDARDFHRAMFLFGQALHAIQDFYAHSTYLECNVPLLRIGCSRGLAIWNGLRVGGCDPSYTVDGVTDLQSGYYKIAPPPGSTTHDALNKDHPGTAQGARIVTRLFPPASCFTYYGAISGQFGASGGSDTYDPTGIAPRHSDHALTALNSGGPVFGSLPLEAAAGANETSAAPAAADESLFDLIARANADPAVIALADELSALVDPTNPDPHAFPLESLDLDGLPVPEPSLALLLATGLLWIRCLPRR
ncbi:MAG: hypothetical protein IPK00_10800 [Deltaproteobacteria bacterium]|nr:hypothetical protein [Deltaproteobacteria bacterium]